MHLIPTLDEINAMFYNKLYMHIYNIKSMYIYKYIKYVSTYRL